MTSTVAQMQAQEISAAIDKLINERADAPEAPLFRRSRQPWQKHDELIAGDPESEEGASIAAEGVRAPYANLLVTLHRTIDAQLVFLGDHYYALTHTTEPVNEYALDLARAINGPAA